MFFSACLISADGFNDLVSHCYQYLSTFEIEFGYKRQVSWLANQLIVKVVSISLRLMSITWLGSGGYWIWRFDDALSKGNMFCCHSYQPLPVLFFFPPVRCCPIATFLLSYYPSNHDSFTQYCEISSVFAFDFSDDHGHGGDSRYHPRTLVSVPRGLCQHLRFERGVASYWAL